MTLGFRTEQEKEKFPLSLFCLGMLGNLVPRLWDALREECSLWVWLCWPGGLWDVPVAVGYHNTEYMWRELGLGAVFLRVLALSQSHSSKWPREESPDPSVLREAILELFKNVLLLFPRPCILCMNRSSKYLINWKCQVVQHIFPEPDLCTSLGRWGEDIRRKALFSQNLIVWLRWPERIF